MKNVTVRLLQATPKPVEVICREAKRTMIRNFDGVKEALVDNNEQVPKMLLKMNHTSIFEHVSFTFAIDGASRALLAQWTRHRMASFTSGSQHYQIHTGFDYIVPNGITDVTRYHQFMQQISDYYEHLMRVEGLPREDARYVLPNACRNSLSMTINARSLLNLLNLRLCNRNVFEARLVATQMFRLANAWFPELFNSGIAGADCTNGTGCRQGKMICAEKIFKPALSGDCK